MQTRRAILVDGSRLIRDFIRRVLENNAGFEITQELNDLQSLSTIPQSMEVGWIFVVLPPGHKIPDTLKVELLLKLPSVKIVGVCIGEDQIQAEWVTRHEKDLTGLNLDEFIKFLRQELNNTQYTVDDHGGK